VLPDEEKITLTEDPMVRDGESTIVGEKITLYRGQRRVVVDRARITAPAIKDLGFSKDAPPPANNAVAAPAAQPAPAPAAKPVTPAKTK
jgi:hypothetical protein